MHNKGPIVEEGKPTRTLNGASSLEKPKDAEAFDSMINQTKQQSGIQAVTLVEYSYRGTHTSRGYPKTINLSDEDIAQLYYLAKRITFMLISASRVRASLERKDFNEIKSLVPECTFRYLTKHFER